MQLYQSCRHAGGKLRNLTSPWSAMGPFLIKAHKLVLFVFQRDDGDHGRGPQRRI